MAVPTLLDIARANGSDAVVGLIDETIKVHPELRIGAARTIKGLNYKTLVRLALGNTTGSFRNANEGVVPHTHQYENRLVETYILNPRWQCDKAVADRHEDGALAYIHSEAEGTLEGEMQALSKQFYYGNVAPQGNVKAFPGLIDMHDATNMVVDATGTTEDTCSSVWLVRFGNKHVQWVWGNNGELQPSDIRIESVPMGTTPESYMEAYVQTFLGYPGLQVGSLLSVVRIKKLTADVGKTLTDSLIAQALAKFPEGTTPDAIFMGKRSLSQLQSSRTATNPTGQPAPFPTEVMGIAGNNIPIYVTSGIVATEKLAL
jgi:hypothetical protein